MNFSHDQEDADQENLLVLDLVQAALGEISPEMRAISFTRDSDQVHLYVAVHEHDEKVDEDVDDLVSELQALQGGPMDIKAHIFVGVPDSDWPGSKGRRVYLAQPPE